MQIVFLGYAVPEECGVNNPAYSAAGNKFELGVLDGIVSRYQIHSISIPSVASFPMEKKMYLTREVLNLCNGIQTVCVASPNLPFVKQVWQASMVYREAKRVIRAIDDEVVIVTYNLYPQIGNPAVKLKRKFGKKLISIIADLPFDDASKRNALSKFVIETFNAITRKNLKKADGYILLNENAKEFIPDSAKYTVVEGGIRAEEWKKQNTADNERKDIIYSGALTDYSGVVQLVEAMRLIKHSDICLRVYGGGYLVDWIKAEAEKSENIIYEGSVPNEQMRALQEKCKLLINPRPTDTNIAKYTFPSKILEYLASGTPVLTSRLNGIPKEYDQYLSYIDQVTPFGIAEAIDSFLDEDYILHLNKAKIGKQFTFEEKTWEAQGKKIIDFIELCTVEGGVNR